MDPDLSDITTVGGQRIVDAIHAQQDDDVQLAERLANLQQILYSQDEDGNIIMTDDAVDEALYYIAEIGQSTWHVEVCRSLCEHILDSSPGLIAQYSMECNLIPALNNPVYAAAGHGRVNILRLLVEEYSGS
jgi:hypothetical protein